MQRNRNVAHISFLIFPPTSPGLMKLHVPLFPIKMNFKYFRAIFCQPSRQARNKQHTHARQTQQHNTRTSLYIYAQGYYINQTNQYTTSKLRNAREAKLDKARWEESAR